MRAEVAGEEGADELDRAARYLHVLCAEGGVPEGFDYDGCEGGDGGVRDGATDADEQEHVGFGVLGRFSFEDM